MTDTTYITGVLESKRKRLYTDELLLQILEDVASGKNVALAVSERGFDAAQYTYITKDLRERFAAEYEDAKIACAQVQLLKAEQDLNPEDDGYWKQPHQIALMIERSKHRKWLAVRLDPSLSETAPHGIKPTAAAMVTGRIETSEVLSPADAYRMMLEGPR